MTTLKGPIRLRNMKRTWKCRTAQLTVFRLCGCIGFFGRKNVRRPKLPVPFFSLVSHNSIAKYTHVFWKHSSNCIISIYIQKGYCECSINVHHTSIKSQQWRTRQDNSFNWPTCNCPGQKSAFNSWTKLVTVQATVPQWIAIIGLIFGGCCSNVFSLEAIIQYFLVNARLILVMSQIWVIERVNCLTYRCRNHIFSIRVCRVGRIT